MSGPYLEVGATILDFSDLVAYAWAQPGGSSIGGAALPGGIALSAETRDMTLPGNAQPRTVRTITLGVIVLGATMTTVESNWLAVVDMVERARRAASDQPQGAGVIFRYGRPGATYTTDWDVVGGTFTDIPLPGPNAALYRAGNLTLYVQPYGRGTATTENVDLLAGVGDFEAGVTAAVKINGAETVSQDTLHPSSGTHSCKVITTGANQGIYLVYASPTAVAYTATVHLFDAVANSYQVIIANQSNTARATTTVAATGVLQTVTVTGTMQGGDTAIRVIVKNTTTSATFWVDAVKLELGSASTRYAPVVTAGATTSPLYLAAVAGNVEALPRVAITDCSTGSKVIQRLRLAVRTSASMGSTDFTPIYDVTAASPGTTHTDATAMGGSAARLTGATSAFQTIGTVTGATSGANQNGLFDVWGKVADSSAPPAQPTWTTDTPAVASASGGTLPAQTFAAYLTSYDGSGHESYPTPGQQASVPYQSVSFYDGAESGDLSLWDGFVSGMAYGGIQGSVTVDTTASYPNDAPGNELGFHMLTAAPAGKAGRWYYKQIPGGGNIGSIRFRFKPVSVPAEATQVLPLVVNSSHAIVTGLWTNGNGWMVYNGDGSTTTVGVSNGVWQTVEFQITAWNAGTSHFTYRVLVDDVQTVAATVNTVTVTAPWGFAIGGYIDTTAGGGSTSVLELYLDDVMCSGSTSIGPAIGSIAYTWNAAQNASGYYLYVQQAGQSFRKIDVGNVTSYTLTSPTAGSLSTTGPSYGAPPVGYGEYQLQYAAAGSNPLWYSAAAVSANVGSSKWEWLKLAQGVPLPPVPQQQDGVPSAWQLRILGKSSATNTPTLDVDEVLLFPSEEAGVEVTWAGSTALATPAQWVLDTNALGYVGCTLYDVTGQTRVGQATVSGQLTLGPHDTLVVSMAEVSDGAGHLVADAVNTQYTVQLLSVTPRFAHWRGAT